MPCPPLPSLSCTRCWQLEARKEHARRQRWRAPLPASCTLSRRSGSSSSMRRGSRGSWKSTMAGGCISQCIRAHRIWLIKAATKKSHSRPSPLTKDYAYTASPQITDFYAASQSPRRRGLHHYTPVATLGTHPPRRTGWTCSPMATRSTS